MVTWCDYCAKRVRSYILVGKICCPLCGKVLAEDNFPEESTFVKIADDGQSRFAGKFVRSNREGNYERTLDEGADNQTLLCLLVAAIFAALFCQTAVHPPSGILDPTLTTHMTLLMFLCAICMGFSASTCILVYVPVPAGFPYIRFQIWTALLATVLVYGSAIGSIIGAVDEERRTTAYAAVSLSLAMPPLGRLLIFLWRKA
ncbi:hypothetical protein C2S52_006604 [Perilla frutescens var. hirtella]|nr:hypothetical protein C2S52_006604 [Perilla frutescens var. hirtella]